MATLSPKGGCGKTTSTFLTGNVLASHLRLRALAVDLNPDFGALADLAPTAHALRSRSSTCCATRTPSRPPASCGRMSRGSGAGCTCSQAPPDPAVMAQMTPALYGELLAFLRRFYEIILLHLGTGVTAPIATFAVDHADHVVVVTTPEWITNTKAQMALGYLRLERATLVLNKVDGSAQQRATERQFSRDRIAQRVAIPADGQLKTMLDSGTFSLSGLGRSTRVPIKRLGLAAARSWRRPMTSFTAEAWSARRRFSP